MELNDSMLETELHLNTQQYQAALFFFFFFFLSNDLQPVQDFRWSLESKVVSTISIKF